MSNLTYKTGEEIQDGDEIRYGGNAGVVDFAVTVATGDPDRDWFVDEFGGGVMIIAEGMGMVFIHDPRADEDLEFVGRRAERRG